MRLESGAALLTCECPGKYPQFVKDPGSERRTAARAALDRRKPCLEVTIDNLHFGHGRLTARANERVCKLTQDASYGSAVNLDVRTAKIAQGFEDSSVL